MYNGLKQEMLARFKVLTLVVLKIQVLWDITLSFDRAWHFEASSSVSGSPFYWDNIAEDLNLQGVLLLLRSLQLHCLKVLVFSTTSFHLT